MLEAVKICVVMGNDVNGKNIYSETALHGAAYRGANLVVQYLVDKGGSLEVLRRGIFGPFVYAAGVRP